MNFRETFNFSAVAASPLSNWQSWIDGWKMENVLENAQDWILGGWDWKDCLSMDARYSVKLCTVRTMRWMKLFFATRVTISRNIIDEIFRDAIFFVSFRHGRNILGYNMQCNGRNIRCNIVRAMPWTKYFEIQYSLCNGRNIRYNIVRAMPQMRYFAKQYSLSNATNEIFWDAIFFMQRNGRNIRYNIYATNEIFRDTIYFVQCHERNILRCNIFYATQWTKYSI